MNLQPDLYAFRGDVLSWPWKGLSMPGVGENSMISTCLACLCAWLVGENG